MKSAIQALLYMKEDHKYYHGDINLNKILNCDGTIKISEFLHFNTKNDKLELNVSELNSIDFHQMFQIYKIQLNKNIFLSENQN